MALGVRALVDTVWFVLAIFLAPVFTWWGSSEAWTSVEMRVVKSQGDE